MLSDADPVDAYVPFDGFEVRVQDHKVMPTLPLTPDELLTTTRSVGRRLDLTRPVPIDLVRECLEVALQAPSGSNRQGWQWMVITEESLRGAIGDYYRRAVASYLISPGAAAGLFAGDPERSAVENRVGQSVAYLGDHTGTCQCWSFPASARRG